MYGTITDWRAYALARGNSAPTDATDEDATAALTRASDYILYNYVQHFLSGYDDTLQKVEYATYEAASLELATPGFFSTTFAPDQQKVLTEVRGIKWTPVGSADGADGARPISTLVDSMLEPYTADKDAGLGFASIGPSHD